MPVNVDPLLSTGSVFSEADLPVKVEFLPEPALVTDYAINLNTQIVLNLIQRLMVQLIGDARLSGLLVAYSAPNVTVSPGQILTKQFFITFVGTTSFTHVAAARIVYLQVYNRRLTFNSDPAEVGVAIPGRATPLAGPNQYRALATLHYEAELPSALAGVGGNGIFTRTAGTWTASALVDHEVEIFDANGRLLGPFLVLSNTTTVLTFEGDATGGVSVLIAHYLKLADVSAAGVVTMTLPLLAGKLAPLAHVRNTDDYTNQDEFYVRSGTLRVLTELDLPSPPINTPGSEPQVLKDEINLRAVFVIPGAVSAITGWAAPNAAASFPVLDVDWGIDILAYTYTVGTQTVSVSAGHDGPILTTDQLEDYIFQDAVGGLYHILTNTAAAAGAAFSFTIALGAGQVNPQGTTGVVRTYAKNYLATLTPYNPSTDALEPEHARTWQIEPDLATHGVPRTSLRILERLGAPGQKFRFSLVAFNNGIATGSVYQTVLVDNLRYGEVVPGTPGAILGGVTALQVVNNIGYAQFSWAAPASGFVGTIMSYEYSFTTDGTTPVFGPGSGTVTTLIGATPNVRLEDLPAGTVLNFSVRVIDAGGKVLSPAVNIATTMNAAPTSLNQRWLQSFTLKTIVDNAAHEYSPVPQLEDPGDGTDVYVLARSLFAAGPPTAIQALRLNLEVIDDGANTFQVKLRVYEHDNPSNGVSSAVLTVNWPGDAVNPFPYNGEYFAISTTLAAPLFAGNGLDVAIELVSGVITTAQQIHAHVEMLYGASPGAGA